MAHPALHLSPALRARLFSLAAREYPHEACGLLLGRRNEAIVQVVEVQATRNVRAAHAPPAFEVDPGAVVAAESAARRSGIEVVGVWHSHPDRPARPSAADAAGTWEGWSQLIVSVGAGGAEDLAAWRRHRGGFTPLPLRP
ncbi:MAG: M67 family metallopeptidase [Planctomycetota bacterium]